MEGNIISIAERESVGSAPLQAETGGMLATSHRGCSPSPPVSTMWGMKHDSPPTPFFGCLVPRIHPELFFSFFSLSLSLSFSLADQTKRGGNEHYHNPCRQPAGKKREREKKVQSQRRVQVSFVCHCSSRSSRKSPRFIVTRQRGGSSRASRLLWKLTRRL